MTLICHKVFKRTLDTITARYAEAHGAKIEVWSFDDQPSRRAAEANLAALGVEARFRSTYKPLLHFFLEEVELNGLAAVHVVFPIHAACPKTRFRAETYPLAALLEKASLTFESGSENDLSYRVTLVYGTGKTDTHLVFAPNRVHVDTVGATHLSPTGWIKIDGADIDERFETDYEALFQAVLQAVIDYNWGSEEPYFEELNVAICLPCDDRKLPVGEEVISLREAMCEDLFFSLLEFFQKKSGREPGDIACQPGLIVPEVKRTNSGPSVRIMTRPLSRAEASSEFIPLAHASKPISAAQIRSELAEVGGENFTFRSRADRQVNLRYRKGSDRPVLISAGQHANETTGIVGALRAARELATRSGAHFVVSPLENPDGYQLHERLRTDNPCYHHHAARFTAFGDDIIARTKEPLFEKEVLTTAKRLCCVDLHLNLHGYSSHEWTRPLSGYLPGRFEKWSVPKGFFILMHYHPGWADPAESLLVKLTERLACLPELFEFNTAQIALFEKHVDASPFQQINGISCLVTADERYPFPLTIISEYPDQTIYGPKFVAGHDAQTAFVLAAYSEYQCLKM